MDSIFLLSKESRDSLLRTVVQAHRCTYICLWFYIPHPSNYLLSIDGWYNNESDIPSSSSSDSLARRLFDAHLQSLYRVENGLVPGFAFKQGMPWLELNELDLLSCTSTESQRRFYQEAKIKTAVFMGSKSGEIELGSSILNNINMQIDQIKNYFTEDSIQQYQLRQPGILAQSQRSLSMPLVSSDADHSSLSLEMSRTHYLSDPMKHTFSSQMTESMPTVVPSQRQTRQAQGQYHGKQMLISNRGDEAIAKAILDILSFPSPLQSTYQTQQTQTPHLRISDGQGAFKPYDPTFNPRIGTKPDFPGQHMMKLVFGILKSFYSTTRKEIQETIEEESFQLHHIITERIRRKKINNGFQELINMLPPLSKKDRIYVLFKTIEYLSALKAQINQLKEKNSMLEAQISATKNGHEDINIGTERVEIQVIEASMELPSSSEERQIELRVRVRAEDCDMEVLLAHLLKCLKQMKDVRVVSMEAGMELRQMNQLNAAVLRLKIKGSTWDDRSFEEAISQAIADLAR